MGRWSRAEIEQAFDLYQKAALEAGTSGNWDPWAGRGNEDASYVEHL